MAKLRTKGHVHLSYLTVRLFVAALVVGSSNLLASEVAAIKPLIQLYLELCEGSEFFSNISLAKENAQNLVTRLRKNSDWRDASVLDALDSWGSGRRGPGIKPSMEGIKALEEKVPGLREALLNRDVEGLRAIAKNHLGPEFTRPDGSVVGPSYDQRSLHKLYVTRTNEQRLIYLIAKILTIQPEMVPEGGLFIYRWSKFVPDQIGTNAGVYSFTLNPNLVDGAAAQRSRVKRAMMYYAPAGTPFLPIANSGLDEIILVNPEVAYLGETIGILGVPTNTPPRSRDMGVRNRDR